MEELHGRVALVTGGSRGLGRAICEVLSQSGCTVIVNYAKSRTEAEQVAASINETGQKAVAMPADVGDFGQVEKMMERIVQEYGGVDILVNNAGVNIDGPFLDMTQEAFDEVVRVNLKGVFNCSQIVARGMLTKGAHGNIINVAASTAIRGRKNGANYCAAKAGVIALTKCMALELAPDIRVNCIVPGFIETDEVVERFHLDEPDARAEILSGIPLQQLGSPIDIGNMAAFLCSPKAGYVTGQLFFVNGGNYTG